MKQIIEKQRTIPVFAEPEVLIVGSGPAGIGAAIAAARSGAATMIVEKYGFVGGNLTLAMVNPMFTFHDIKGRQVIRGIADEFVQRMIKLGLSHGHVTDLTFDNASMTPFDPEGAKVLLFEMLEESGVDILLHSQVVDAQIENKRIKAIVIENKSGRQAICPHYVVDCSADADVVVQAGAPVVKGRQEDTAMQPATLYFRIGGVDDPVLRRWMKSNRHLLKDSPTNEEIDNQKAIAFLGMNQLIREAIESGELDSDVAPRILMYELPVKGLFSVNSTRIQHIDGTNTVDLTRAEIGLRKQVLQIHQFLKKHVGGFENSFIIDTGIQAGIRETRHIIGDYTLTEEDVLDGTSFPDGICCGTFAIDIHPPQGKQQIFTGSGKSVYEIPYRCLLPQGIDNLLVAGRSISASHVAFGSIRVMATCMAIGQGAGTAIAMIAEKGCPVREINVKLLRQKLIAQGQYLLNENIKDHVDKNLILKRTDGSGEKAGHYNPFQKI